MDALLLIEKAQRESGTVGLKAVPEEDEGTPKLLPQNPDEGDHHAAVHIGVRVEAEVRTERVTPGSDAQRRNDLHLLMGPSPLAKHRRAGARPPASTHQRSHETARLIEEDQPGLQPRGFF